MLIAQDGFNSPSPPVATKRPVLHYRHFGQFLLPQRVVFLRTRRSLPQACRGRVSSAPKKSRDSGRWPDDDYDVRQTGRSNRLNPKEIGPAAVLGEHSAADRREGATREDAMAKFKAWWIAR